jgi:hypothetical protein
MFLFHTFLVMAVIKFRNVTSKLDQGIVNLYQTQIVQEEGWLNCITTHYFWEPCYFYSVKYSLHYTRNKNKFVTYFHLSVCKSADLQLLNIQEMYYGVERR